MGRVIVFDVWARFAYFRRHYTTTTASTHPFIPRSAVEGLIGAILGLQSGDYPDLLWNSQIAIELRRSEEDLIKRVTKFPFGVSYTHSDFWSLKVGRYLKKGGGALNYIRAPRSIELLKEPKYRIYFSSEHPNVYSQLLQNLREHHTYYTPYLGSSNMVANFEFVGEHQIVDGIRESSAEAKISSIIPFFTKMPKVKVTPNSHYAIEQNIPLHITNERKTTGYYSAVYSPEAGQTILASGIPFHTIKLGDDEINITFISTTQGAS